MVLGNRQSNMVSSICRLPLDHHKVTKSTLQNIKLKAAIGLVEHCGINTVKSSFLSILNREKIKICFSAKMLKSVTKENFQRKWNIQRSEAKNVPFFRFTKDNTTSFVENFKLYLSFGHWIHEKFQT